MEIKPVTEFNQINQQSDKLFPRQFVFLLSAQSKGGKTTVIANCLKNKRFSGWNFEPQNIYLFSKTGFIDDNFRDLRLSMREVAKKKELEFDEIEKNNIKTHLNDRLIREIFAKRYTDWLNYKNDDLNIIKEPPPILIIIDDFLGNKLLRDQNGALCIGIPVCRHINISFVVSSQTYKSIHPIIRKNTSHLMIGQINNIAEIRAIAEEQSYILPPKWLLQVYLDITKNNDYQFLFIDTTKPIDQRFRRSFTDFIPIPSDISFYD